MPRACAPRQAGPGGDRTAEEQEFPSLDGHAQKTTHLRPGPPRPCCRLVRAPANWSLLTGSPAVIERIWRYFGIWYQHLTEGRPPGTDWLTGKPLSYDIAHQDALLYLDAGGHERFLIVGSPNAAGAPIGPVLRRFLSAQGHADLSHPDASTWTATEALSPIAWLTGRPIHPPAS